MQTGNSIRALFYSKLPDLRGFALIQNNGSLSRNLTGLNTSEAQVLQFHTASRNTAGPSNLTVSYGGQTLLSSTAIPKITGGNPCVLYDIPFTPATASGGCFSPPPKRKPATGPCCRMRFRFSPAVRTSW
jgi:hypothetical protein